MNYTLKEKLSRISRSGVAALAITSFTTFLVALAATRPAFAQTETVLYSFCARLDCPDGNEPLGPLFRNSSGDFYGTTYSGGTDSTNGFGTVFEVRADGSETVWHSFGQSSTDGKWPSSGVIMDNAGNMYGTAPAGGVYGGGIVFKLGPDGVETVLYSFGAAAGDGNSPMAGLVMDTAGNLYGTASAGGANLDGTIFEVTPDGTETTLFSFSGSNGTEPIGGLLMDGEGNFYGTTIVGGPHNDGVVFEYSASGVYTVLYNFGSVVNDGEQPQGTLIMDSKGNLYGTASQGGGTGHQGTVFKLSASADGTWKETTLHSFSTQNGDGLLPTSGLVMDAKGDLYGDTQGGGAAGHGLVFAISPIGTEKILYAFPNPRDGEFPGGTLLRDASGHLFGVAQGGGHDNGSIYEVMP